MNFVNSLLLETNCKYKSRKNTDCENRSLDSKITLYKQDFVNIIFFFHFSFSWLRSTSFWACQYPGKCNWSLFSLSAQKYWGINHLKKSPVVCLKTMTKIRNKVKKIIHKKSWKSLEILNKKLCKISKDHLKIKKLSEKSK